MKSKTEKREWQCTDNSKWPNIRLFAVFTFSNWFRSHPTNWTNITVCLSKQFNNLACFSQWSEFASNQRKISIQNKHTFLLLFLEEKKNSWHSKILNIFQIWIFFNQIIKEYVEFNLNWIQLVRHQNWQRQERQERVQKF
jgi:hypothetical protein